VAREDLDRATRFDAPKQSQDPLLEGLLAPPHQVSRLQDEVTVDDPQPAVLGRSDPVLGHTVDHLARLQDVPPRRREQGHYVVVWHFDAVSERLEFAPVPPGLLEGRVGPLDGHGLGVQFALADDREGPLPHVARAQERVVLLGLASTGVFLPVLGGPGGLDHRREPVVLGTVEFEFDP